MCDIRLFRSARMDYRTAEIIWREQTNDEMILNNAAYHLQLAVKKILKGALECVGVTVPYSHKISRLVAMVTNNGANLIITEWLDDHAEMLSEWETETRYNMDFLVEKRKLDRAMVEVRKFMDINGIRDELREELQDGDAKERLLQCLPEGKRDCTGFELSCYYILFKKKLKKE